MVSNIVNLRSTTIPSVKATVNALSPTFGTQKQWDRYMIKFKKQALDLFVSHSKPSFEKNIIKRFPNAMFLHSKQEPLPNEVDAVIAITIHTDHSLYYYAKQYKSKGILFIHCATTNIDIIEDEIIRVIGEVPEHD